MDKTAFGDRMKDYEAREAKRRLMPLLPAIARLDGKGFSKFTRGLERPYDVRLSRLMQDTALHLLRSTAAVAAYTQSDEITLIYSTDDAARPIYLDGRVQKLVSILAASATAYFNRHLDTIPEKAADMPLFDCRVWTVPNRIEAANTVLWRVKDAIRNSVAMAAQAQFTHKQLQGRSAKAMRKMLLEKGVKWVDYPDFFKWGTLYRRVQVERRFSADEIATLPEKHAARRDPSLVFTRTDHPALEVCFADVSNRVEVLFEAAAPD